MLPQQTVLPPATRTVGGLLAAARPLPPGWERGVKFPLNGCSEPILRDACDDNGEADTPVRPGNATFVPFFVRQAAECSTMSGLEVTEVADERLAATREWAVGRELQTGGHTTGNPDGAGNATLAGAAQIVATELDPVDALACVEQHAADNLFGATAFVHVAPLLLTHLLHARAIWRDGRLWRTGTGNVVVSSPGYSGSQMYVTSEVFAETGGQFQTEGINRATNTSVGWSNEIALAAFDTCWSGRVTTTVTLCAVT